ncbi:DUF1491 family protein [Rhodovibrionaceae bacterium A322]
MFEERLPTHLWLTAALRQCNDRGQHAYVLNKGEQNGGLVLLKLVYGRSLAALYIQQRDLDGNLGWMSVLKSDDAPESEADAYIERAVQRDPDLWVVEIEAPPSDFPLDGKRF